MPVELFRCFFQWTMTDGADVEAGANGSSQATIDFSTPLTPPGMSRQRAHFVGEEMVNRDAEGPLPVDLPHFLSKIRPMVGAALEDVVLPLMDHLVGQGI
ncbi:MAG: hypothetical protein NW700_08775 [Nitrospiraceae bacterium]|nr:hypothetical protein [Nitrospira tepida]